VIEPVLRLIFVLMAAGLLTAALAAVLIARMLVRPPRMNDGKALYVLGRLTPRDLDLPFEAVWFDVRDERTRDPLRLSAWHVPASRPTDRTVVLVHGYADAKVGALAWAPAWHELGFHLLLVDLRAHGDSGGTICSGGFWERHDLCQVIGEWTARKPDQTRKVYLFGASLGAAAVAGTAALLSSASTATAPLAGVVLDSPYVDFRSACSAHLERIGMPGGWIRHWALRIAGWMANADFGAVRPVDLVQGVGCPLLVFAPQNDAYVLPNETDAWRSAMADRAVAGDALVPLAGVDHLMGVVSEPEAYRSTLSRFVNG
jgi:alpha-beta hydrolase superfamily lysophospholipase